MGKVGLEKSIYTLDYGIPRFLRSLEVNHPVHRTPTQHSIPSQLNPTHTFTAYFYRSFVRYS
jgi:hypothetical protein